MIRGCRTIKNRFREETGYLKRTIQMRRLEKYAEIIESVIAQYDRKSHDKTMMIKGTRKDREDTTNRRTHQDDVAGIVSIIAKKKKLSKIAGIIARHHDIGHTFMGHSGEWWISNVLEDYGLGAFCHNTLGASELIYKNEIYDKIIEKIQLFYPNIKQKELKRTKDSLWLIMDGINAHNGEIAKQEFVPQVLKTEKDFEQELLNCFTKKGFDKKISPASTEACLMRLADQISYIPFDMADGLREKFINGLDEEYIVELERIGITRYEVKQYLIHGNYDELAKRVQDIFVKDLDENSTKRKIAMSDEKFAIMINIKRINDRQIVDNVLPDMDLEIYSQGVRKLIEIYKDAIIRSDMITKIAGGKNDSKTIEGYKGKYENTPYKGLIEYTANTSKKNYEFRKQTVELSILESIAQEQEQARQIVIENKEYNEKKGFEKKASRMKGYINYYKNKLEGRDREYSIEEIEGDIKSVTRNIHKNHYNNGYTNMKESIAIVMGAKYLATLSDREYIQQLMDFKIIGLDQKNQLTVKYKDIDIHNRRKKDENWEKVRLAYDQDIR